MPFYKDRCLNLAHRGALRQAPENTLPAFQLALEQGADGFELDVNLSADGELVVIHDNDVSRTTDGQGYISEMAMADIRHLDAGSWFAPEFTGTRIPTLNEVLYALPDALVNIELKGSLDKLLSPLPARVWECVKRHHAEDRVLISCFNPVALWQVWLAGAPKHLLGLLRDNGLLKGQVIGALGEPLSPHAAINPRQSMLTPALQAAYTLRGLRVNAWFTGADQDTEADLYRLIALGVDSIISNRPDIVSRLLHRET